MDSEADRSLEEEQLSPIALRVSRLQSVERLGAYEFQQYVRSLLSNSGYFDWQIFSVGTSVQSDHGKRLVVNRQDEHLLPDVLVANGWMESVPRIEFRFGILCRLCNTVYRSKIGVYARLPYRPRRNLTATSRARSLELYVAFGAHRSGEFRIGVARLQDADHECGRIRDQHETGNYDLYDLRGLMNWRQFILDRKSAGDPEPDPGLLRRVRSLWIGSLKA